MREQFERGDHVELADELLDTLHPDRKSLTYDEGHLWRYHENGLWQKINDDDVSRVVQNFAGRNAKNQWGTPRPLRISVHDVKGAKVLAEDTARFNRTSFADAPLGVSFLNGFLEVGETRLRLKKPSRSNMQKNAFAFEFKRQKPSRLFLDFVASLFRDDADALEKIAFIQEFFGASLLRIAPKYQKCLLLIGDGENGKDTLLDIISNVFPNETVCSITPTKWKENYHRATLAGKWLNKITELPDAELETSEAFKGIVAGGEIDARHPYGRVFNFRPVAGHAFACNANMGTSDFSHGFFRRFGIVRLNRRFTKTDRDPDLRDKLTIEKEIAGIVAWLLEGAARVLAKGGYTIPASSDAELTNWRRSADQVALFIDAETRPPLAHEKGTRAGDFYAAYSTWAEANGHRRMTSTKFGERAGEYLRELNRDVDGYESKKHTKTGVRYMRMMGAAGVTGVTG